MAGIYAAASELMVTGAFNWSGSTFYAMLVGPGYTPNYATDTTLSNIPGGSQLLGAPLLLTGLSTANGFCSAASPTWSSLTTTAAIEGVAILQFVGGIYKLVAYIDTGSGFGQTPTASPVQLVWSASGIFRP